jgi:hypothetical protein
MAKYEQVLGNITQKSKSVLSSSLEYAVKGLQNVPLKTSHLQGV